MITPHVILVGSDKGGVGKTTISRTLMDYYKAHGISHRAFDTETPKAVLQRFHPDKTRLVDLSQSDGQMQVFDTLREAQVTLIDIRAGLLSNTLKTLSEIGFLSGVQDGRLRITVLHVIGSSQASFDEISSMASLVEGAKHHLVANHINDSKFLGLTEAMRMIGAGWIHVDKLNELAADTVDRAGVGFDAFCANTNNSETLRGYVRHWLKNTFAAYDAAALNAQ